MTYVLGNYMGSALGGVKEMVFSKLPFFGNSNKRKEGSIFNDGERYNF